MKNVNNLFIILAILFLSASCAKEGVIEADASFSLSFQREGKTEVMAGTTFYVTPTGSGEFLTLYSGVEGRVWGEPGAKGVDFNKADSMGVQYKAAGKYMLSLVSTSMGDFGKETTRKVNTVEVTVLDDRNSFTIFYANGMYGEFLPNNVISFKVPDVLTDFNFVPTYALDSDISKVYVNGDEQVSGITINDFVEPVVYTIKSSLGTDKQYTVTFTTFTSATEKSLTNYVLGYNGSGEKAVIDEENKTINLAVNYKTKITSVKLKLVSSLASTIIINGNLYNEEVTYNLTLDVNKTVKVVAQDKSEAIYTLIVTDASPVTSFTFSGLVPAPQGIIDDVAKTVTVDVLKGTDVTKLAALWTGSLDKVKVGTVVQANGITLNNFEAPVIYTFYKGAAVGAEYTVTVNVK